MTTGAATTVTPTVSLSGGSASAVTLDRVVLRTDDGEVLATATDLGALSPGGSLSVPLTTTFDDPGERSLEVRVVTTDEDDTTVTATRPVSLVVEQAPPQLELRAADGVTGVTGPVTLRLANPTTAAIRNVEVELRAPGALAERTRRTVASLGAGASTNLTFGVRPTTTDRREVTAVVRYTDATGVRQTVRTTTTLDVDSLEADVDVRVDPVRTEDAGQQDLLSQLGLGSLLGGATGGGGAGVTGGQSAAGTADGTEARQIAVTVTNFGNTRITDLVVTPTAKATGGGGERDLGRRALAALAPGESATVVIDLSQAPPGTVEVAATYSVAGQRRLIERTTYEYRPDRGAVTVTGVSLAFGADGTLQITGNAGNVGTADVTGVVVAVGNATGVAPTYPQRDYFIGTVEASEFAPFDLTARVDARNASTVPIRIRYVVDGEQRVDRIELPYDDSLTPPDRRESGGDGVFGLTGLSATALGAGLAIALVLLVLGGARLLGR